MSVSLSENITAVIETCFSETKDEIQDMAINRILELIRADRKTEPQSVIGESFPPHITESITQVLDGWHVNPRTSTTAVEDETQTRREDK